ncbi:DUF7005 family protein [Mastigocoleus testarum]|uniref:Uncharacterized protein n=1 Tax=Mastigocoleus testarum BC008 TaxID=371196 RepID=A0A0V7ZFI0_9CYAN|nr:hypothetical protein [Mastigocoleus testarum]KST62966.1 hypothetical protein BC008_11450 [Mastigocoleus testarum BC008]KST63057.1 hypothetical protein BC008_11925 [Mastigocoleus testarum BC008]
MNRQQLRARILAEFGASDSEVTELLNYNENIFESHKCKLPQTFPPVPEAHIAAWEKYVIEAEEIGSHEVLKNTFVQLQFPILSGISKTEEYRAATRQGGFASISKNVVNIVFKEPEKLQIKIHETLAGFIPVIIAGNRQDFVTLVQAITKQNEPQPVPDSMGACIVSGYNNWNRIYQYQKQWKAQQNNDSESEWSNEFKRLIPRKELYQDKFIILSTGPYSNVPANKLGLTKMQWQQMSLKIRLEHECTHYFTRRFFGSMRNNLLDELIADYRGIVAAIGSYRSDWFLHFIGLESFPNYREGGRLQNYRGEPPLSEGAFKILQTLVVCAAKNLENFDKQFFAQSRTLANELSMLLTLSKLTLEELASSQITHTLL